MQNWYILTKVLHALTTGSKTCLLVKNVLMQQIMPNLSMAMLDMNIATLGHGCLKRVRYMKMEECTSIATPPEVMTLNIAAYAKKVITKPE